MAGTGASPAGHNPNLSGELGLPGLLPEPGDRWRNKNTGGIVAIVSVRRGHKTWVTIRRDGVEHQIPVSQLERSFERIESIPREAT